MNCKITIAWCSALVLLCSSGCAPAPLTQLVVDVDTDLRVPGDLTRIEISITEPDGASEARSAELGSDTALPVSLGIVHRGGPLGPVIIVARGIFGTSTVVERRASVTLVEGRTLLLPLHLEAACIGVPCETPTSTCERGVCRPTAVDPSELTDYEGIIPRLDVDGGTSCLRAELCNGRDDTCDGMVDEGFDRMRDPSNCGTCGNACPAFANSVAACVDGVCAITCAESFGDCDGEIRTGCEQSLSSLTMCGACGEQCTTPHGTPSCFDTTCTVASCAAGYGDCDMALSNGCEMLLNDLDNCGRCGQRCAPANAVPNCAGAICSVATCLPGFDDCTAEDGCETPLGTTANCNACGNACPVPPNATAACSGGRCGISVCAAEFGNCNGMTFDGCETSLRTVEHCGACNAPCVLAHATALCGAAGCEIATCEPGFADCDGRDATGCEASLAEAANCGTCGVVCSGATPVCNAPSSGGRRCESVCGAVLSLCGASCVDTDTSLLHCGACGNACTPAHGTGRCGAGACEIAGCDPGWDDCDGLASNGCETQLNTLSDCGACDRSCALPSAISMCMGGSCAVASCSPLSADCDGGAMNGCEARLDSLTNCGSCGRPCSPANATATCGGGTCGIAACNTGHADCDGMAANGCETPLDTLTDCGGCGTSCDLPNATESCATRSCQIAACDAGWADCTAAPGCETPLGTETDCTGCGVTCGPFPNAQATCATGACLSVCQELFGDCGADPGCETSLDTLTDCGACGVACTAAGAITSCSGGTCRVESCTTPRTADCNGSHYDGCEIDTATDPSHCGGCGIPCESPATCVDGVCS